MDLQARLRRLCEALPEGGSVLLTRAGLAELLGAEVGDDRLGDYSVVEAAGILQKAPSTVRSMIGQGRLRAYRLGKAWRITAGAIRDLRNAQGGIESAAGRSGSPDLGCWERHYSGDPQ